LNRRKEVGVEKLAPFTAVPVLAALGGAIAIEAPIPASSQFQPNLTGRIGPLLGD
jgi:hypothetical protein